MLPQDLPLAETDHFIVEKMDDEILLYDTQKDQAHVLNQTAALVWKLSNGRRTVAEITLLVAREFHTEPNPQIVAFALAQLSRAHLLKQPGAWSAPGSKLTRREFLQKASIATHPIYTDSGWVKAIDLRPGMDCYRENGSRLTLQNVSHPFAQRQTVYNLQVGNFHTYFVGDEKVWVHNRTTIQDIPTS